MTNVQRAGKVCGVRKINRAVLCMVSRGSKVNKMCPICLVQYVQHKKCLSHKEINSIG